MPGVFEPCTRLDHLGWLRYLASQTRFLVASDRSQVARRRSVWILVTGIIEQQLNQSSNQLVLPCPVVMHSPVTGLFRVLLIGFFFHHPSPLQEQRTTGHRPIGSPFSIATRWMTGLCAETVGQVLFLYVSVGCFFHSTTRRYEIDLSTTEHSQGQRFSHEAQ